VNEPANPPSLDRRAMLSGAIGIGAIAFGPAASAVPAASLSTAAPRPVTMTDAQRVEAFMKMRSATDGRLTIGWLDGMNYAFIDGETFPMYRLLAATWYLFEQKSDTQYDGLNLEIAFFLDPQTGERLTKLTMPQSGKVVDVPLYRAGPSPISVVPHRESRQPFGMPSEGADGKSFFNSGTAVSRQWLSQPQIAGELFLIREDSDTVVTPADPSAPRFFYREWTLSQAKWADVVDPKLKCVRAELGYSGATAWRPWMQMGKSPGCTLQNGRGGKALSPADLPPETLALAKELHPDLLDDPVKILKASNAPAK
jgi:hypothetical protein